MVKKPIKKGKKGTKTTNKVAKISATMKVPAAIGAKAAEANGKPSVADLHSPAVLANFRDVFRFHGERPRGSDFFPNSTLFEGRFGRMFRTLEAAEFIEDELKALAAAMIAEREDPPTPENEDDDEENQDISAGYTYLGQFIDHDLTFDPASSLQKQNDPDALEDFRTPRFDLDCVYGRGPNDQPYLYEDDGVHLLLGRQLRGNNDPGTSDLQRNRPEDGRQRALIGDPRNDENVIVSQLQGIMIRFHNSVADFLKPEGGGAADFEEVQNAVRWHYQWIVLKDFLRTVAGQDIIDEILPHLKNGTSIRVDEPKLTYFGWKNSPFMPIEFSAAAYRFGHSMVRPIYRLNTRLARKEIFSPNKNNSLEGFRAFPVNWAIDWSLFFEMGNVPAQPSERLQKSYRIDSSLVNPLGNLPSVIGANVPSLAERNLIRGWRMGLPSGQTVARYMDLEVIPDEELVVGKAIDDPHPPNKPLMEISANFADNAPLWYYILAEAQHEFDGARLGPVGSRIVAEVFIGLLLGDQHSFLSRAPSWKPFREFTNDDGEFGIADLIKQAMKT
jgi:hypothetical protein